MNNVAFKILSILLVVVLFAGCSKMPDNVMMEKAKVYENEEKFSEAISKYEKLGKLYPQSEYAPEAIYRAGLIYVNALNDAGTAIQKFQQVIQNYPDNKYSSQCLFMIGFVYANTISDTANARIAYSQFLEKYPDHELVPSVNWELKYLGKDINEIPALKGLESKAAEK